MRDLALGFSREVAEAVRHLAHDTVRAECRALQRGAAPGATGRWFMTPHAVRAFMARAAGASRMTYEQALGEMIREAERAHFIKALDTGPQLWRGPGPRRMRYIVTVCSHGDLPACVTVLPPFDGFRRRR